MVRRDVPALSAEAEHSTVAQNLAIREEFLSKRLMMSCPGCGLVGTLTLNGTAEK